MQRFSLRKDCIKGDAGDLSKSALDCGRGQATRTGLNAGLLVVADGFGEFSFTETVFRFAPACIKTACLWIGFRLR